MPPLKQKKQEEINQLDQVNQVDPNQVDKDLLGESEDTLNSIASLADAVSKKIASDKVDNAMSSVPADAYKIGGSTQVTASTDKKAYQGPLNPDERKKLMKRVMALTLTDIDMSGIDKP